MNRDQELSKSHEGGRGIPRASACHVEERPGAQRLLTREGYGSPIEKVGGHYCVEMEKGESSICQKGATSMLRKKTGSRGGLPGKDSMRRRTVAGLLLKKRNADL